MLRIRFIDYKWYIGLKLLLLIKVNPSDKLLLFKSFENVFLFWNFLRCNASYRISFKYAINQLKIQFVINAPTYMYVINITSLID